MKPHTLIAAAVVLGLGIYLASTLMVSEEGRIRARLDELADQVSKTQKETLIVAAVEARKVADFFADDMTLRPGAPFGEMRDKTALTRQYTQLRHMLANLQVQVVGREIVVDGDRADVGVTLRATYNSGDGPGKELREFQMKMVKRSGDWLIQDLQLVSGH